jgi:hypothetical protein
MPQQSLYPILSRVARPSFALIFAALTGGCFAVPTPYRPNAELDASGTIPDVRTVVGDSKSKRPLRLGQSTRADVERVLRQPTTRSSDGSVYVYAQQFFSGWGVVLPPFYGASGPLRQRTCFLQLAFDSNDVLRGKRVESGASSDAGMGYMVNGPDRVPALLLTPP